MSPEETRSDDGLEPSPSPEEFLQVEDAYASSAQGEDEVGEDDPQLLDATARSIEASPGEAPDDQAVEGVSVGQQPGSRTTEDDESDAGSVADDSDASEALSRDPAAVNWDRTTSPHEIVVELKRVESEVRDLLEGRDRKRKRKLDGTRRWHELEEDLLAWRYAGVIDESTNQRLRQLVARRHYLFTRLSFLATTRPVWNS